MIIKDPLKTIDDFRVSPEERLESALILFDKFSPDLSAICEIDLHCHSFFSDGYLSPSAKVFEAFRRNMKAIAIADHDLFDGQLEAIKAGEIFGVDVVPASEFYSDRPGIEIIAYFPDKKDFIEKFRSGLFNPVVEEIRSAKKEQLDKMINRIPECFARLGFKAEITNSDIFKYVRNGLSTKGDISVIMWQKYGPELSSRGIATDVKDFQARYTTKADMLDFALETKLDMSPSAFVERIFEWGGLAGIPHPTELRRKEGIDNVGMEKVVEELAAKGLQCIEVDGWRNGICPETGLNQTTVFDNIRESYNRKHPERLQLLFTNGSDDHNQPGEGLELGSGRNANLNPEFGRYENVGRLRDRQKLILADRKIFR
ncbi:MAG TPA: hypothetical protein PK821_04580 [Victivallales bacterium]|nr:hypothetical protein [Victivallales bacterium]